MTPSIKDKIEREAAKGADEYVEQGWFKLEYSSFGTTAKECEKAYIAGFKAAALAQFDKEVSE